jgi:murein L,D-transpeptidase YcbB/YkuD
MLIGRMLFNFSVFAFAFLLGRPAWSSDQQAGVIKSYVAQNFVVPIIKPLWGNFILHPDSLNRVYSLRQYRPIWVNEDGSPNGMSLSLKDTLLSSDRHGLNPSDYWDKELDAFYAATKVNTKNWITFELIATEALIRYVSHLSSGRFDPERVDTDVKFKRRDFSDFMKLSTALEALPSEFSKEIDTFAPRHPRYRALMNLLTTLRLTKSHGGWSYIAPSSVTLKQGVMAPVVRQIRQRFIELGYLHSQGSGSLFDQEFENTLKRFQSFNGMNSDGIIGTNSPLFRILNVPISQRITQVELAMEKLRWLPAALEGRHIFVNLATAEFFLFEEAGLAFKFRAVTGQPFRRTPSMVDLLRFVNLNPYWTVPWSIATKDKLPKIKEDPEYLSKNRMILIDGKTEEEVDPSSINWESVNSRSMSFLIRQLPGPENALGVVKFPLQNPWAIFMHDTNEKQLFGEANRHRSSGCVRLEKPLDLAAYLLRDQPEWSLENILNFVPLTHEQYATEIDKKVFLTQPIPVYFLYLTAEQLETGEVRFVDDVYGQDLRLSKAINGKRVAEELF